MLEKIEDRRRRGRQRVRWLDGITDSMDMRLSRFWEVVKNREAWSATANGVTNSWTQLSDWTSTWYMVKKLKFLSLLYVASIQNFRAIFFKLLKIYIYLSIWLSQILVVHAGSSVSHGIFHRGTQTLELWPRLSCFMACRILVPGPGIKSTSPALRGRFLTTGPNREVPKTVLFKTVHIVFSGIQRWVCSWVLQ